MDATQLSTLKTTVGNDLGTLVDFLTEIRFNAGYAVWQQDAGAITSLDIQSALASTAWQTSSSPTALVRTDAYREYLVVNSLYFKPDGWSASAETLCMTHAQWKSLSIAHAGDANYSWLAGMKGTGINDAFSDVVSLTGKKADIDGYIAKMISGNAAVAGNFVYVEGTGGALSVVNGQILPPTGLPQSEVDLVNKIQGTGTSVPVAEPGFIALPKQTVATIRGQVLDEAVKKLVGMGELAWTLWSALRADTTKASIDVTVNSDELIKALTAVGEKALANSLSAGKTLITVARSDLDQMALALRKGIPATMSALFEAQLVALPSGDGLQTVDMSAWLGSALYKSNGKDATGLFNILKLEGFDPSVKSTAPATTATKGDLAKLAGDLIHDTSNAAKPLTEATAETIRAWADELARGGTYAHGVEVPSAIAVVTSPSPVLVLTSDARKLLDATMVTVKIGLTDLQTLSQKTAAAATFGGVSGNWIDTGVGTAAGSSDTLLKEIESATQTPRTEWKMAADPATNTYKILDSTVGALLNVATQDQSVLQATASIDDLVIRRNAGVTFANHAGWIQIADDEASGKTLLQKLKALDASIAVYDPLQEADLGKAKLGVPAWIVDASGKKVLAAQGATIDYWEAHLQITQEESSSLMLKEQLDLLRPDKDTTAIDLGVWNKSDTLFKQLKASAALAFDPDGNVRAAFDPTLNNEVQLVKVNGENHLQINRETLDTWSLQLALKASILDEVATGNTGSWAEVFAKQVTPRGGKLDVTRARVAYVVTTLGRGIVWLKKDLALERMRQVEDLIYKPAAANLNNFLLRMTNLGLDAQNARNNPAFVGLNKDQIEQTFVDTIALTASEYIASQKQVYGNPAIAAIQDAAGNPLIDIVATENAANLALQNVRNNLNGMLDPLTHLERVNVAQDVSNMINAVVQDLTSVHQRMPLNPAAPANGDRFTDANTTLQRTLGRKIAYYESAKEGMQVDRLVGGFAALGWSFASFAGIAKVARDDKNTEYGPAEVAYRTPRSLI